MFMLDLTVWTNSSVVASVVSAGYQVIAAPSDYWYLDHLTIPWTTMYTYDPTNGLTSSQVRFLRFLLLLTRLSWDLCAAG
jgi:hypothetical protein